MRKRVIPLYLYIYSCSFREKKRAEGISSAFSKRLKQLRFLKNEEKPEDGSFFGVRGKIRDRFFLESWNLFGVFLAAALCLPVFTGCSDASKNSASSGNSSDEELVTIELDAPSVPGSAQNLKRNSPQDSIPDSTQDSQQDSDAAPISDSGDEAETEAELQMGGNEGRKIFVNSKNGLESAADSENSSVSQKKNVILMIADGTGFGAFCCAAAYETGSPKGVFYQQAPWNQTSVATFHKKSFYDPAQDWADFKNLRVPFFNKEPAFIPPDSASTGTAMMTGVKTRNGRVGIGPNDERLETIAEIFHRSGRAAGAVTSYQIASATMADAAAHDVERKNGQALFAQLFLDGNLDVIIGAAHPDFDDDGIRRPVPEFGKYGPSPELWAEIQNGKLPEGWAFFEKRSEFQKLAAARNSVVSGNPDRLPEKVLGFIPTANSSQFHRRAGTPRLETSPTLSETALAALNVLSLQPSGKKGFFLMIEGGAVDCANDANDLVRCMEEMQDFNEAVKAVCRWVETYSSWEETLVIVTADHDNGAIYGPECDSVGIPSSAPLYHGKGVLPDAKYYSDDHTKQLVPLYARGPGAEKFAEYVVGTDERMGKFWDYDGRYIDNTSVFTLMMDGMKDLDGKKKE